MEARLTRPAADECSDYYLRYTKLVPDGDIVQTLRSQHPALHDLMAGMSEAQASASPAPGEWSAKQVLQHLVDTERLFVFRAMWFARGEQSALPGMEPNPWVDATDANARTVGDLMAECDQLRAASISFFANLSQDAWLRRGSASDAIISVRALAWITAGHELHHMRSLREEYL